jgi:type III pantothenate kinase
VILLTDIGNSRVKWALASSGRWQGQAPVAHERQWRVTYDRLWGTMSRPKELHACCVAGAQAEAELTHFCRERWNLAPVFFRSARETLGVVNDYRRPEQLGADRWAALLAARLCAPGWVCVVDCGTAITVDVMNAHNHYIGGAILPGAQLAREALHNSTGLALEVRETEREGLFLGLDTAECVASGLHYGLAGAIDRLLSEVKRRLHLAPVVLMTGGAAARWAPLLTHASRAEPELVLRGIARAAGL